MTNTNTIGTTKSFEIIKSETTEVIKTKIRDNRFGAAFDELEDSIRYGKKVERVFYTESEMKELRELIIAAKKAYNPANTGAIVPAVIL